MRVVCGATGGVPRTSCLATALFRCAAGTMAWPSTEAHLVPLTEGREGAVETGRQQPNFQLSVSASGPRLRQQQMLSGAELGLALPAEPDRATFLQLAPSKSCKQPGLPRSSVPALLLPISPPVPWVSWLLCELLLSHHGPAKGTRAALGRQSSLGAQQWLKKAGHSFSPHVSRPRGLPHPAGLAKGHLPGLGSCTRATISGVPCTSRPHHGAPAQSSHAQEETSITPGSSPKDNTSEA